MNKIILLHGALGSEKQFYEIKAILSTHFDVVCYTFSGHGGKNIEATFRIETFAEELELLINKNGAPANIFGYSMGGYVALYLASIKPYLIKRIFTLATKFAWNFETVEKELKMLIPEKIEEKLPKFAAELQKRHFPHDWKLNMKYTAEMMIQLSSKSLLTEDVLKNIEIPVLLSLGDKDTMVSLEETIQTYRNLPNASLLILPDTPHPLEKINTEKICREISEYFHIEK
jgi:pimeloyl-ACP methyl ester carboxylesterase